MAAAQESRSMDALEHKYAIQLDFGGISSEQASPSNAPTNSTGVPKPACNRARSRQGLVTEPVLTLSRPQRG